MIEAGRVAVNGETVTKLGTTVETGDLITVDGRPLGPEKLEYHLLNKPAGVLSSVGDARGRTTVTDLVPSRARLFPIGRLDLDTTGLIIMTNDGELAHSLMHPRFEVDKVYRAEVEGAPAESDLERLREGISLEDGKTAPAEVTLVSSRGGSSVLEISIHEGRKRQVRRMLEAIGHPVRSLRRIRYATLSDSGLAPGDSRPLRAGEIRQLQKLVERGGR